MRLLRTFAPDVFDLIIDGCLQGIYAPEMLLELTTPRVLIMEWVEGQRLRRAGRNGEGPSREELQADLKLVEIGVQCSLEQAQISSCHAPCSAALQPCCSFK